ncbi:hypothetical protein [Marisediminicola senii]|uniref:hypothetical protein n=1 Tax=Marisediminicola senii TaxID=2711233 RepID=UPI0013EC1EC7|nr:hypothetical protein [Marisediminicola senii]
MSSSFPPETPLTSPTPPTPSYDSSSTGSSSGTAATAGVAKEQAAQVGSSAVDQAKSVAGTAKGEAGKVASEATAQAKQLFGQAKSEFGDQAGVQTQRAATGLRSIGDELKTMAESSEQGGLGANLVSEAASRASGVASWLDGREPADLLSDVKDFARRRPGTFIAIAAVAGIVAGRLTRSVVASNADDKKNDTPAVTGTGASSQAAPAPALVEPVAPLYTDAVVVEDIVVEDTYGSGDPLARDLDTEVIRTGTTDTEDYRR